MTDLELEMLKGALQLMDKAVTALDDANHPFLQKYGKLIHWAIQVGHEML